MSDSSCVRTGIFAPATPGSCGANAYLSRGRIFPVTGREATGEEHTGRPLFVPAGILFGLGVGLIIGFPGPGVLTGLGLGFLISAFATPVTSAGNDRGRAACRHDPRWISALLGVFLIGIGIGFVLAPVENWPYLFGVFLVGLGLWFLARNCRRFR